MVVTAAASCSPAHCRHAAALERTIGARLGRPVLHAHAIEAAYFYDPAAPKISALSLARPLGHMSAMTVGYSAVAAFACT